MKKFMSLFLLLALCIMNTLPVFAEVEQKVYVHNLNGVEKIESNSVIKLAFAQDFNVNESEVGQRIKFVLTEQITDSDNTVLPQGTRFIGHVMSKENSKFGFRRARANVVIDRLILPSGKEYIIYTEAQKGDLVAPAALNAAKGVGMTTAAAGVCVFGAMAIAIECLSIGGMILAPYTGAAVGGAIALSSKGLNCKAKSGTPFVIVLKHPIEMDFQEF